MSGYGYLNHALKQKEQDMSAERLTIGRVIDNNDPQQMGRVRAVCPAFGEGETSVVGNIPWAMYVSPLGGVTSTGKRGAEQEEVSGPVAYGMWNIPKVGSYVLVGCIDGNTSMRFYAGCIQPQFMTHTMPHGRYTWNDPEKALGNPDGPLDSTEEPIEPLYSNFTNQFTANDTADPGTPTDPRKNMEWRSRGADVQVSAITNLHTANQYDSPGNKIADHEWGTFNDVTEENGETTQIKGTGYGVDQQSPDVKYSSTGNVNYDSMTYSWTTPGFHSISMNDRHDTSRIRLRTTSGHQIIMDDTNERIYINSAGGESWIEIDKVGNIDIYASKNISTHAGGDINFTTDKAFRVEAKGGIHLQGLDEDVYIKAPNIRTFSTEDTFIESSGDTNIFASGAGSSLFLKSVTDVHVSATTNEVRVTSGSTMHLNAGGQILQTGSQIHFNGPPAGSASSASSSTANGSTFYASRVPQHEPWARVFRAEDTSSSLEYPYNDPMVGKGSAAKGEIYDRNPLWHR